MSFSEKKKVDIESINDFETVSLGLAHLKIPVFWRFTLTFIQIQELYLNYA